MLRPSMSQILKPGESYYEFVVAVAQQAREIASQAEKEHLRLEEKPVTLAVQMFASGEQKLSDLHVTIGRQRAAASEAAPAEEPAADDVLELEEDEEEDAEEGEEDGEEEIPEELE